jgi:hypothetical protein
MGRIYDRLPGSLKKDGEESLDALIVQGADLQVTEGNQVMTMSSTYLSWPFGLTLVPGFIYDAREVAPIRGDYAVGVTSEKAPYDDVLSLRETLLGDIEGLIISGEFLNKDNRPENLYLTNSINPYRVDYPGATLSIELPTGSNITKVYFPEITVASVIYDGTLYENVGELEVSGSKVTLTFPIEGTTIPNLSIDANVLSSKQDRARSSFYLQPIGREQIGERFEYSTNLYIVNYTPSRGFSILNDLRKFGEESDTDLTKAIIQFYDDRLEELYALPGSYVRRFMNPYLAYSELYVQT